MQRPGDLFRVTPGLMAVQHAGGGKANQYLLRGFDADHGTDIALSFDGLPLNMVSHGHGQGYADANWIIPELVERVEISKGPYFVEQGDFATAGAVDLISRSGAESFVSAGGGSFDTLRGVAIAAPTLGTSWQPLLAAELVHTDGPFEHPEDFKKYNLFGKLTYHLDARSQHRRGRQRLQRQLERLGPAAQPGGAQRHRWGSSARSTRPRAARRRGRTSTRRFACGPTSPASSTPSPTGPTTTSTFTRTSRFLSRDPVNGDAIQQWDERSLTGGRDQLPLAAAVAGHAVRFHRGRRRPAPTASTTAWPTCAQRERLQKVVGGRHRRVLGRPPTPRRRSSCFAGCA